MIRGPLLLVAAWLLTSCVEEATIPSLQEQVIELQVVPGRVTLGPGEVDTILVIAINNLGEDVDLFFETTCQILAYVRNNANRVVVPEGGSHECVRVGSQLTIPAGGRVVRTYLWDGGSRFGAEGSPDRLPAGKYFVWAQLDVGGYRAVGFPVLVTLHD